LSFVLAPEANWYSRTSPRAIWPRAILPATLPPIPNPALPRLIGTVASSPGGRVPHWLAVPTGGDVPAGRLAPRRTGFAGCASRLGRRRVTAFYPARFERFSYVESIPQYTPHRRHFLGAPHIRVFCECVGVRTAKLFKDFSSQIRCEHHHRHPTCPVR
jgi:hypothetical protein